MARLKWRKIKHEWRAGPFSYIVYDDHTRAWIDLPHDLSRVVTGTAEECRAACERLAARILTATRARKRGRRK